MNAKLMVFIGVGFELGIFAWAGIILGKKLDHYMGWDGPGVLIMIFLCLASWSVHFIYLLRKLNRDASSND